MQDNSEMPSLSDEDVVVVPKRKTGEVIELSSDDDEEMSSHRKLAKIVTDAEELVVASKRAVKKISAALTAARDLEAKEEVIELSSSSSSSSSSSDSSSEEDDEELVVASKRVVKSEPKEKVEVEVTNPIGTVISTGDRDLYGVALSGDGQVLVTFHYDQPCVGIYNVAEKKLMHTINKRISNVFFVSPSSHLAVGYTLDDYWLVDTDTGKVKQQLGVGRARHFNQGRSNDGRYLAICNADYPDHVLAWDLETGELGSVSYGDPRDPGEVHSASISPALDTAVVYRSNVTDPRIVSANSYMVEVTDKREDEEPRFVHKTKQRMVVGTKDLNEVSYSPDGKYVLVIPEYANLEVFDAVTAKRLYTVEAESGSSDALFTADSKQLVVWFGRRYAVYDVATGQQVRSRELDDVYDNLVVAPGGRFATCTIGNSDTKICVIEI